MKALEKDRDRRYSTANALANDIASYLANDPVTAGPPGLAYRVRKFIVKHRMPILTAAALLFLLVAGTIVSTSQAIRANREARRATQASREATNEAQKTRQQEQIAKAAQRESLKLAQVERKSRIRAAESQYIAEIAAAQNALEHGDRATAARTLAQCDTGQRQWEWYYLQTQVGVTGILPEVGTPNFAGFAPNGTRFLTHVSSTGSISLWDAANARRLYSRWPPSSENPHFKASNPVLSPDGTNIAWSHGEKIEIMQAESGVVTHSWPALHDVFRLGLEHYREPAGLGGNRRTVSNLECGDTIAPS